MKILVAILIIFSTVCKGDCLLTLQQCQEDNERLKSAAMVAYEERDDAKRRMVQSKGSSTNEILGWAFAGILTGMVLGAALVSRPK